MIQISNTPLTNGSSSSTKPTPHRSLRTAVYVGAATIGMVRAATRGGFILPATPAGVLQGPVRSAAKSASISNTPLTNGSSSSTKPTPHRPSFTVSFAASMGMFRAIYKKMRPVTTRKATLVPNDCPRNGQTLEQLRRHVTHQYSDNESEALLFIRDLLNVKSTQCSGIGPMDFGEASGNLIFKELLIQTLCPTDVAKSERFAESQLNFMKRVVAVINTIFKTTLPEDCVIQCEKDPSKFRLVIDKIPDVFEVLKKDLVTVIKHKETGVTLTMIRHFPTHFPDRMPSNAYPIKQDPQAIETHCKQIMQNLTDLYKNNTFSEEAENNHLFVSNRSMIGSLTMIANKDKKETEIFELSGKKPDLPTIFSSIF